MGTTGYHASQDWDAAEDIGINLVLKNVHALQETLAPATPPAKKKPTLQALGPGNVECTVEAGHRGRHLWGRSSPVSTGARKEKLSSLNVPQGPSTDEASSYASWQRKDV